MLCSASHLFASTRLITLHLHCGTDHKVLFRNRVIVLIIFCRQFVRKSATTGKRNGTGKDSGHKAPFLSIVKRARVNNFASTKFAEYEIVCQLRLASQSVGKEKTFKWSVWKRFSDFEQLNTQLRKTLGWNMDTVPFPSSHTFTMSKLAPDFMEQRRCDLSFDISLPTLHNVTVLHCVLFS